MKMISTYISLLLLCGFMLLFYYCNNSRSKSQAPAPVNKTRTIAKRPSLPNSLVVHPFKYHYNGSKQQQTQVSKTGFSFFKDVVTNVLPVLKNLN